MKAVSEIMNRKVKWIAPTDSVVLAAEFMNKLDIEAIPVCKNGKLVGMVTDRDIVVKGVARQRADTYTKIQDIMNSEIKWCLEDDPVDQVLDKMAHENLSRLPVLNNKNELVGLITLKECVQPKALLSARNEHRRDITFLAAPR